MALTLVDKDPPPPNVTKAAALEAVADCLGWNKMLQYGRMPVGALYRAELGLKYLGGWRLSESERRALLEKRFQPPERK